MSNSSSITSAQLSFNEFGTPVSSQYDDVYFSNQDGQAETEYVFLGKNQLPERWLDKASVKEDYFVIGETGFGTGLNFFVTWLNFINSFKSNDSELKLMFFSFEKHPLTQNDLRIALKSWPQFAKLTDELLSQYPEEITSDTKFLLNNNRVELRLIIGDVNERIPEIMLPLADAWYLDGFAPSKNPEMWTQNLFDHISRLTKPGGTIATFTAAGFVRRGLIESGFQMQKHKGFGKKREMIAGQKPNSGDE